MLDSAILGQSGYSDLSAPLVEKNSEEARVRRQPVIRKSLLWFDRIFAVPFVFFLFITLVLAITSGVRALLNRSIPQTVILDENSETTQVYRTPQGVYMITGLILISALGTLLSIAWIQLMVRFAAALIDYTSMAVVVLSVVTGIAFFCWGSPTGGILLLIFAGLSLVYYRGIRKRIRFASANLRVACRAIKDNPTTILAGLITLIAQVVWSITWAAAVMGSATNESTRQIHYDGHTYDMARCTTYSTMGPNVNFTSTCTAATTCLKCVCDGTMVNSNGACFTYRLNGTAYFFLLVGFFWACTVIKNVVHCTVSGAVASWWFSGISSPKVVWEAFRRACSTSLGSICLGSLLVSIVKSTRQFVYFWHKINRSQTLGAIIECLLGMMDQALSYFNRYAYVYVAVYGLDFRSSGRATTDLFRVRGVTALINDQLIYNILTLGCTIIGLISAVVGYGFGLETSMSRLNVILMALYGAFFGFVLALVVSSVIESAVSTIFVCFAEDPQSLSETHPELYATLVEAWEVAAGPLGFIPGEKYVDEDPEAVFKDDFKDDEVRMDVPSPKDKSEL